MARRTPRARRFSWLGSYCMADLIVDLLSELSRRNLRHAVETCAEIFALQLGLCRLMEQIVRA